MLPSFGCRHFALVSISTKGGGQLLTVGSTALCRLCVPLFGFMRTCELDPSSIQCTNGRHVLFVCRYTCKMASPMHRGSRQYGSRKWGHGGLAETSWHWKRPD